MQNPEPEKPPTFRLQTVTPLDFEPKQNATSVFFGQKRIRSRVELALEATKHRGETMPHVLFIGDSGSGKTLFAYCMAGLIGNALDVKVKVASGRAILKSADLAGLLTNLEEKEVLVIDNIDSLPKALCSALFPMIGDFKMDLVIDQGPNARSVRLNLPTFTLICTATRKERLSPALIASFPIVEEFDEYDIDDRIGIVREFAKELKLEIDDKAAELIARSKSNLPKDLLNLLRHIRDFAQVKFSSKQITYEIAAEALKLLVADIQASVQGRLAIASEIRREVWRRDEGKCVKCGSRENLEYDHIIPLSKGGSNTARNIELLCEKHNREKRDFIQ